VLYASRWQVIYGLAEVVGDPENDPSATRWCWRFALRPLLALDDLREAPPVEAAGVMTSSLGRHSYIRLTPAQFAAAGAALAAEQDRPLSADELHSGREYRQGENRDEHQLDSRHRPHDGGRRRDLP
jgi:hypothetical protein